MVQQGLPHTLHYPYGPTEWLHHLANEVSLRARHELYCDFTVTAGHCKKRNTVLLRACLRSNTLRCACSGGHCSARPHGWQGGYFPQLPAACAGGHDGRAAVAQCGAGLPEGPRPPRAGAPLLVLYLCLLRDPDSFQPSKQLGPPVRVPEVAARVSTSDGSMHWSGDRCAVTDVQ